MKLLFICDEYPPGPHGGIGTAVQLMARTLVRQGHQVWVAGLYDYGYGGADEEVDEGVQVFRLRKRSEWLKISMGYTFYDKVMRKLLSLTGLLEKETEEGLERLRLLVTQLKKKHQLQLAEVPDHQHYTRQVRQPVYFPDLGLPTVARLHGGNAFLATARGRTVSPAAKQMEQHLLRRATAISSVSRYAATQTLSALALTSDVMILPNGMTLTSVPDFKAKIPQRIIFTGSLEANKGVFQLMKAWNEIHQAAPSATLDLYGKGNTAPLKALLSKEAANQVFFHGHQPREKVLAALQEAEIGVFPSYAETFGLAPLEAMAAGVATVFTTRAAGPELIQHGTDGMLVDPDAVSEIAAAVLSLFRQPEKRRQLAQSGYEKVKQQYSMAAVGNAHINFYQTLISAQAHEKD